MPDTNSVSYALRGNPPSVREHLLRVPMAQVCISSITEAELLFGLALKPQATKLAELVNQFLLGVSVLPWDSAAAQAYADLCSASWKRAAPSPLWTCSSPPMPLPPASPSSPATAPSVPFVPASASPTGPSPFDFGLATRLTVATFV